MATAELHPGKRLDQMLVAVIGDVELYRVRKPFAVEHVIDAAFEIHNELEPSARVPPY